MTGYEKEVAAGKRFAFGKNWQRFLEHLDDARIAEAEKSLKNMLGVGSLEGRSFVDIGSGSGLFSLAARRLGARVHSFDYDRECVGCTGELKRRHFAEDPGWKVEGGSVLDRDYLRGLGTFDVVYSWGVLHQTGAMWDALGNVAPLVGPGGKLYISIYNDQGGVTRRWIAVKWLYNHTFQPIRLLLVLAVGVYGEFRALLSRLIRLQNPLPFGEWREYKKKRGMSRWHDLVDWVGGWPHEVAKPERVFDFYRERGFALERLTTCGAGHGCNEYVFRRENVGQASGPA